MSVSLFVCLFVCPLDYLKGYERILMKFSGGVGHGTRNNRGDADSQSEFKISSADHYSDQKFYNDSLFTIATAIDSQK